MRKMSSRNSKGFNTWKVVLFEVGLLVYKDAYLIIALYTFITARPSVVIRLERSLLGIGVLVPGKLMVVVVRSEKSPAISANVGSVCREGFVKRRIFFHSCPPKKKSLPFLKGPKAMGPPRLQPKSLKRSPALRAQNSPSRRDNRCG